MAYDGYYVDNPDDEIMTCREELEMKGVWEAYMKFYEVDPDIDMETPIYIHKDNAVRIGLM